MATKKRIFYFDELRAIAILAVVFCHSDDFFPIALDNFRTCFPFFVSNLGRTGVPIFLMLSGALLLNREYDLLDFFKRRYTRILVPFIFWVAVTVILKQYLFLSSPEQLIKWACGDSLLWYIWELLGLYLFLPIINEFIKKFGRTGLKYYLILWVAYLIMLNFNIHISSHFTLEYFGGYMGYFVLGYYLVNTDFKISDRSMIIISFILFIGAYVFNCILSLNIGKTIDYLYFTMILQGVGAFLTVRYIAEYTNFNPDARISRIHNHIENGWIGKMLVSISICSYGMYFVHYIIYCLLKKFLDPHSLKLIPILFIIMTISSWLIILALSKIPYVDKISGAK